jgi:hypothetical protein
VNCCDDYGQCKQGPGCPARATPVPAPQPPLPVMQRPYTVRDALKDIVATVALCAVVALVAFNLGYWLH